VIGLYKIHRPGERDMGWRNREEIWAGAIGLVKGEWPLDFLWLKSGA